MAGIFVRARKNGQSYFMRYLGLLNARLGKKDAHTDVYKSMTIAASEDHPDVVADAKYFLGRVYLTYGKPSKALHEFRAALDAAKRYQMGLLETNALVGIASAELKLGDAYAALETAFFALRRANECLWGLRQVEALTVIGEAYLKLGQRELGARYLHNALASARDRGFHLHEEDIAKLLAAHPEGGLA
jgi:tetratricopeptide (TPR) repeat protein